MKTPLSLSLACAVFLTTAAGAASAATAFVSTEVNGLFERNAGATQFGCPSSPDCDRDALDDVPLLIGDQDGVSVSSSVFFENFAPFNVSSVPNYVHQGTARAQALPGSLHADVDVQLTGAGGGSGNISGVARVLVRDQIRVTSSTLAPGTLVTLNAGLDITGHGRGRVGLDVRGRKAGIPGLALLFGSTNGSSDDLASLASIAGQFTAEVGSLLDIEYFLQANTGVRGFPWTAADIANGRAASSNYGNSAYLYFSAADPLNVTLQGTSGYDYVRPSAVPLPAACWLLLPGLALLARCRRTGPSPARG